MSPRAARRKSDPRMEALHPLAVALSGSTDAALRAEAEACAGRWGLPLLLRRPGAPLRVLLAQAPVLVVFGEDAVSLWDRLGSRRGRAGARRAAAQGDCARGGPGIRCSASASSGPASACWTPRWGSPRTRGWRPGWWAREARCSGSSRACRSRSWRMRPSTGRVRPARRASNPPRRLRAVLRTCRRGAWRWFSSTRCSAGPWPLSPGSRCCGDWRIRRR